MSLKEKIFKLYKEQPDISGKEIQERLNMPNSRTFWQTLENVQTTLRGGATISKSKSGHVYHGHSIHPVRMEVPKE